MDKPLETEEERTIINQVEKGAFQPVEGAEREELLNALKAASDQHPSVGRGYPAVKSDGLE